REGHGDLGAAAGRAGDVQLAVVGVHELGDDGQADAAAGDSGSVLAAVEPVEDAGQLIGRDARSGVADLQPGLQLVRPGLQQDAAAGRGEFQRVGEQVRDYLVQPSRVACDLDIGKPPLEADAGRAEGAGEPVGGGRGNVGQVTGYECQLQGGRLRGGQPLQVIDHAGQPQHLVAQRRQLPGGRLGYAVQQGFVTR